MLLSDLKILADGLFQSKHSQVSVTLRDKLFHGGMPLSVAKETAIVVTLGSPEEKFIEEVAEYLCKLYRTIVPELGVNGYLFMLSKMPTIQKDYPQSKFRSN